MAALNAGKVLQDDAMPTSNHKSFWIVPLTSIKWHWLCLRELMTLNLQGEAISRDVQMQCKKLYSQAKCEIRCAYLLKSIDERIQVIGPEDKCVIHLAIEDTRTQPSETFLRFRPLVDTQVLPCAVLGRGDKV